MHAVSSRVILVVLAVICLILLGSGLWLGNVKGIDPCYLCNFQRFLYVVMMAVALFGTLGRQAWQRVMLLIFSLIALGGVVTAAYQSWMQFFPESVTECGFGDPTLIERLVDWLGVRWPNMFLVTGFCTQKDWVFLGLSLANWSAVCYLLLAGLSGYFALFKRRM